VNSTHPEYDTSLSSWERIRDVLLGAMCQSGAMVSGGALKASLIISCRCPGCVPGENRTRPRRSRWRLRRGEKPELLGTLSDGVSLRLALHQGLSCRRSAEQCATPRCHGAVTQLRSGMNNVPLTSPASRLMQKNLFVAPSTMSGRPGHASI